MFSCVRAVRGRPLPALRSDVPVVVIFWITLFTDLTVHLLLGNCLQIALPLHPFSLKQFSIKPKSFVVKTIVNRLVAMPLVLLNQKEVITAHVNDVIERCKIKITV